VSWGGFKIPSNKFDYYSSRAVERIEVFFNVSFEVALYEYNSEIQKCICEVAENIYKVDQIGEISSEKTLTYSVAYNFDAVDSKKNEVFKIVQKHLSKTSLLFRGLN